MNRKDALEEFFLDQKLRGNSKLTTEYYERALRFFYDFVGDIDTNEITLITCKRYVVHLQEDPTKSTVTVQSYVRALRAYLKWLYDNEYIEKNIPEKLKLPKAQFKVQDILTEDEIQNLLSCFDENTFEGLRNLCMISFMLGSGLRLNEVITMQKAHVHVDAGYAIVNGKGNKQRNVPISEFTKEKLEKFERIRPNTKLMFTQSDGKELSRNTMKDIFRKLKIKTGIPRLHAHLLRHTFATMYLGNGGNIYTLQTILGHTSLEMVKKYLHISPQYVVANFASFSPLDVKKADTMIFGK